MIQTLLRAPTFMRHMQLAILACLTVPVFNPAWAEAENLGGETAERLSDIPYIACFMRSADRYGVDVELAIAVAIVESSLNPDAVSSSDAVGVMQIKWPLTAEHLGITQRELLFDPCINIDAGVSYLKELIDENADSENNDPLVQALASYHVGPTTIANAVTNTGTLPQQAAVYAEAVFKQRDILAEEGTPSEQITEQIAEPSANEAVDTERALAEETASLQAVLDNAEESQPLNVLGDNQATVPASTNTFSNQTLDITDTGQQNDDLAQTKPEHPCSTAGVRSLLLGTHNPDERGEKFRGWLGKTGVNCTELQLLKLRNSLPLWLGTALNSELLGAVEMLMEAKGLQP